MIRTVHSCDFCNEDIEPEEHDEDIILDHSHVDVCRGCAAILTVENLRKFRRKSLDVT
jgi:hypothetical protein